MNKISTFIKAIHLPLNWILTIVLLIFVVLVIYRLATIQQVQQIQGLRQEETYKFFYSSLSMDAQRQRYIMFMRRQIIQRWREMGDKVQINYDRAYRIAEVNYRIYTMYPFLKDPLFMLAMQKVESNFGVDSISPAGAKGLNQIMELTARYVCPQIDLTYNDSILFDIDASTRIAAKNLEILYATYHSYPCIIAGYNGGGLQVYFFMNKDTSLSMETKLYIPAVLYHWQKYKDAFNSYRVEDDLKIDSTGRQ